MPERRTVEYMGTGKVAGSAINAYRMNACEDTMRWIYRLQQRIAITRSECNILLVLCMLCGLGLTAQYVQSQPRALPSPAYDIAEEAMQHTSLSAPTTTDATRLPTPADTTTNDATRPETNTPKPEASSPTAEQAPARMNLNTATATQLERLPRIGPKLAVRILEYRKSQGAFQRVEDLTNVRGIGEKTLAKLAPYVFVGE